MIVQGLVQALMMVKLQVVTSLVSCLFGGGILMHIDFLVCNRAPQSLRENVIQCQSFSIHTDVHVCRLKELPILRTGEMAPLVAITDRGSRLSQRPFERG